MPGGRREAGCKPPGVGSALPGASRTGSVPSDGRRVSTGAERSLARSGGSCGSGGGGGGSGRGGERRAGARRPLGLRQGRAAEGEAGPRERDGRKARVLGGPSRLLRRLRVRAVPGLARGGAGRGGRGLGATGSGLPSSGVPCVRPRPDLPGQPGVGTRRFACALPRWNCSEVQQRLGRSHSTGTWWDGDGPRPGLTFHPPPQPCSRLFPWGPRGAAEGVSASPPEIARTQRSGFPGRKFSTAFVLSLKLCLVLSVQKLPFGPVYEQTRCDSDEGCGGCRVSGHEDSSRFASGKETLKSLILF
jgi:hypothetical protein